MTGSLTGHDSGGAPGADTLNVTGATGTIPVHDENAGVVYLVGAGPGDPELITVKGLRLLRAADVVVYDRLVDPALLDQARGDAILVYVGKGPGHHSMPQEEINAILVAHARQGRTVVRLKGGDPFVFGRGGEEAEALVAAGLPFEIVPGISSSIAVPAYAGIPVTHRGHAPLFTVVTGHEGTNCGHDGVDWAALARLGGTLVVLMGVAALPGIAERLRAGGLAPETPAAVIAQGTTARQRMVVGTLADVAERAAAASIAAPAITVIGPVVGLAATLAWFQTCPNAAEVAAAGGSFARTGGAEGCALRDPLSSGRVSSEAAHPSQKSTSISCEGASQ